jgi:hypothetical protein
VLADVRGGFVSREAAARDEYGVAHAADGKSRRRRRVRGPAQDAARQAVPSQELHSSSDVHRARAARSGVVLHPDHGLTPPTPRPARRVDIGGTFTDITLLDPRSGRIWTAKTPSTPRRSVDRVHGRHRAGAGEGGRRKRTALGHVLHGTTVATNIILEGKGAKAALITTPASATCSRSAATTSRARPTSTPGSSPSARCRPSTSSRSAGGLDADGSEVEAARRGGGARAARAHPRRGRHRDRDLLPAQLRQRRAHEQRAAT